MSPLERFRYIRSLRMPLHPKMVLYTLAGHAKANGTCWISRPVLANESGISEGSTYYAVKWLCAHGLIIRQYRRGRSSAFKVTLEAFQELQQTPSQPDAPPRHSLTTEVATVKVRTPKRNPDHRSLCACGNRLGDGDYCIPCRNYRESLAGIRQVLPTATTTRRPEANR